MASDLNPTAGTLQCPYKLLIIGGGPAGCSILIRAIRTGFAAELCEFCNIDPEHKTLSASDVPTRAGVCVVERGSLDRFGGGKLQDYIINSNTYASKFVTNVIEEKLESLPKETVRHTALNKLSNIHSSTDLQEYGNKVAPLQKVGAFLKDTGCVAMDMLKNQYPNSSKCLLETSVTSLQKAELPIVRMSKDKKSVVETYNGWKVTVENSQKAELDSCKEAKKFIYAHKVVLATGGIQELPRLPNAAHNRKLMSSDYVCTQQGVNELRARLIKANNIASNIGSINSGKPSPCKVVIVGGSHSAFSAAWICLNKLNNPSNSSTTTAGQTLTSSYSSAFSSALANQATQFQQSGICIIHKSAIKVFYATKAEADRDGYIYSSNTTASLDCNISSGSGSGNLFSSTTTSASSLSAGGIHKAGATGTSNTTSTGLSSIISKVTGQIHPFGGLRGDAKDLWRSITVYSKDNTITRELRVKLLQIKSNVVTVSTTNGTDGVTTNNKPSVSSHQHQQQQQSIVEKLFDDAVVIIWACGYSSNISGLSIIDSDGVSPIALRTFMGQVDVDDKGRVMGFCNNRSNSNKSSSDGNTNSNHSTKITCNTDVSGDCNNSGIMTLTSPLKLPTNNINNTNSSNSSNDHTARIWSPTGSPSKRKQTVRKYSDIEDNSSNNKAELNTSLTIANDDILSESTDKINILTTSATTTVLLNSESQDTAAFASSTEHNDSLVPQENSKEDTAVAASSSSSPLNHQQPDRHISPPTNTSIAADQHTANKITFSRNNANSSCAYKLSTQISSPPTLSLSSSSSTSLICSTASLSSSFASSSPVEGLLASGLGFGLQVLLENGQPDGSSGRADGVAVYLKRGATLILAQVLGNKVFGGVDIKSWEERSKLLRKLNTATVSSSIVRTVISSTDSNTIPEPLTSATTELYLTATSSSSNRSSPIRRPTTTYSSSSSSGVGGGSSNSSSMMTTVVGTPSKAAARCSSSSSSSTTSNSRANFILSPTTASGGACCGSAASILRRSGCAMTSVTTNNTTTSSGSEDGGVLAPPVECVKGAIPFPSFHSNIQATTLPYCAIHGEVNCCEGLTPAAATTTTSGRPRTSSGGSSSSNSCFNNNHSFSVTTALTTPSSPTYASQQQQQQQSHCYSVSKQQQQLASMERLSCSRRNSSSGAATTAISATSVVPSTSTTVDTIPPARTTPAWLIIDTEIRNSIKDSREEQLELQLARAFISNKSPSLPSNEHVTTVASPVSVDITNVKAITTTTSSAATIAPVMQSPTSSSNRNIVAKLNETRLQLKSSGIVTANSIQLTPIISAAAATASSDHTATKLQHQRSSAIQQSENSEGNSRRDSKRSSSSSQSNAKNNGNNNNHSGRSSSSRRGSNSSTNSSNNMLPEGNNNISNSGGNIDRRSVTTTTSSNSNKSSLSQSHDSSNMSSIVIPHHSNNNNSSNNSNGLKARPPLIAHVKGSSSSYHQSGQHNQIHSSMKDNQSTVSKDLRSTLPLRSNSSIRSNSISNSGTVDSGGNNSNNSKLISRILLEDKMKRKKVSAEESEVLLATTTTSSTVTPLSSQSNSNQSSLDLPLIIQNRGVVKNNDKQQ